MILVSKLSFMTNLTGLVTQKSQFQIEMRRFKNTHILALILTLNLHCGVHPLFPFLKIYEFECIKFEYELLRIDL
jgi:hypothetical protein